MEYGQRSYGPPGGEPLASAQAQSTGNTSAQTEKPIQLQKHNDHVESSLDYRQQLVEKQGQSLHSLEPRPELDRKYSTQSAPSILVTQHQDPKPEPGIIDIKTFSNDNSQSQRIRIFGIGKASSPRQPSIPEESAQHVVESPPQHRDLVPLNEVEVEGATQSQPSTDPRVLPEGTIVEIKAPERGQQVATPQEHVTSEESTQKNETLPGPIKDPITESEIVVAEFTPAQSIGQCRLSECGAVPVSKRPTRAKELSYVHDFSDCPVNKAVLDHYERENKKAQEHELSECIRTSLPTELIKANSAPLVQHTLAECSDDELIPIPTAPSGSVQHALADCSNDELLPPTSPNNHRSSSYNFESNRQQEPKARVHRLVSCPTPPVLSHQQAENAHVNASEDRDATQRPVKNVLHSKSQEGPNVNRARNSTGGAHSASSGASSQSSTENACQANTDEVVRRHKRRHKPSRKQTAQFLLTATDGNQHGPSDTAQCSLEGALAANGGKTVQESSKPASNKSQDKAGKDLDSSAATAGDTSGQLSDGVRSEEGLQIQGGSPSSVSNFWGKLTGSQKASGEEPLPK